MRLLPLLPMFFFFSLGAYSNENGGPYANDEFTVLLMHFDGDVNNEIASGNDGVAHGATVSYEANGVHGQCLRLDNSKWENESWLEVPFYDALNFSTDFSIEFWFKLNSNGVDAFSNKVLLRKEADNDESQYEAFLSSQLNFLQANLNCEELNEVDWNMDMGAVLNFEPGKWYHMAFYYRYESGSMFLLVRDENYKELFSSSGYSPAPPVSGNGNLMIGYGGGGSFFDGWIDELRISNIKRTYRDDVLEGVDPNQFPNAFKIELKDSWGSYQWPLGELFPVNNETGEIFRKNHCGPTMLSRVMHYWEFPRFASGVLEHNMSNCDWYVNFDSTEYLWDLMPYNFPSDVNPEEYGPAATFAMHIGASSRESYDNIGCYPEFLINHFHYSPKTRILHREDYKKDEWINILKNEISNGRPVCAGGVIKETISGSGAAGHYYVIDGYNENNEFHTDYSLGDNVWDDPDDFDYGFGMSIIVFLEPDWQGKKLELVAPQKQNSYLKNSNVVLEWTSSGVSKVDIEFSMDGGRNWVLIANAVAADLGVYTWDVPNIDSDSCKIRISDTDDLNINSRSELFDIYSEKTFQFKFPQEGSVVMEGVNVPIYWDERGIESVKFEYSTDGGVTWILMSNVIDNGMDFNFTFQTDVALKAELRATDLADESIQFMSGEFIILVDEYVSFRDEVSYNDLLLLNFENNYKNSVTNELEVVEAGTRGIYEANYPLNLGKAYGFDNTSNSYLSNFLWIDNSEQLSLGKNWSIEAWVKLKGHDGGNNCYFPIIVKKEGSFDVNVNNVDKGFGARVQFENGSMLNFDTQKSIDYNKWYHVALISDSVSQTLNFIIHNEDLTGFYSDQKSFPEGSMGVLANLEEPIKLGGDGGPSNQYFYGSMDEFCLSKRSKLDKYVGENMNLPFVDNFESDFESWRAYSKKGGAGWHLSDDAQDGTMCARMYAYEATEIEDDWLVTKEVYSGSVDSLTIEFDYYFFGENFVPEFYYTSNYKYDIDDVDWIKVDFQGTLNEWNWNKVKFNVKNNGERFAFAFRYQTGLGDIDKVMIDNFAIKEKIEALPLPFIDDFSENISSDATFENWTTENLAGWQYWHIIPSGGINEQQCMRFEKTDLVQNDWLITKAIDCENIDQLGITFNCLYNGDVTVKPRLLFTNTYNGDASQSDWTLVDYTFPDGQDEWHLISDLPVDVQGEVVYFAFHYSAPGNNPFYLLLDNFQVKEYDPIPAMNRVGESDHFEFFTTFADSVNYYTKIKEALENEYKKLCSHWNRPGQNKVFNSESKIKIYYGLKEHLGLERYGDSYRCGFYMADGSSVYLTPLLTEEQKKYYGDLKGESILTFAKMAVRRRLSRDVNADVAYMPGYFGEAFGLYEMGYRPDRDSVKAFLEENPGKLNHESIADFSLVTSSKIKDMIVSYVEGQILLPLGYKGCWPDYGSYPPIWNNYLTHFYDTTDVVQIKFFDSSENFDIYCSSRDTMYTDSMLVWMERTLKLYQDSFQMTIDNRFHACILYDEKTGMDLTGYDDFNGGAGGLNISPHNFFDGIDGYPWLLAHEFGHVFNDYMYYEFPFGFYHEGMANFSGYKLYGVDWMESKWQVPYVFNFYKNNYSRYPTLEEFETDPHQKIDPYFFGLQFIRYLESICSMVEIKQIFEAGIDYSVIGKSRQEIEDGYLGYLGAMITGTPLVEGNEKKTYIFRDGGELLIKNEKLRSKVKEIVVYDWFGRELYHSKNVNTERIPLSYSGSVLVKLITDSGFMIQKVGGY